MRTLKEELAERRNPTAHPTLLNYVAGMETHRLAQADAELQLICYGGISGTLWRGHCAWLLLSVVNFELGTRGVMSDAYKRMAIGEPDVST